jgi:hypothetical protein
MNDFFQSQSFHAGLRPRPGLPGGAPALQGVMRSFDEIPFTAFRPSPLTRPATPGNRKARSQNRK